MMFGAFSCLENIRTLCTQLLNNPKAVASGSSGTEFLGMHHWLPETAVFKKMDVFKAQHVLIRRTFGKMFLAYIQILSSIIYKHLVLQCAHRHQLAIIA